MQREADPRTPMAWQHRDLNYHQSGYQDRYGPGAEGGRMAGPPSTSDRLSHRTDKSWRAEQANMAPYGGPSTSSSQYPPRDYPPRDYPHSRDLSPSDQFSPPSGGTRGGVGGGAQGGSRHSATATSTISSSSSEDDSEQPHHHQGTHPPPPHGHPAAFGYGGHYPGYPPSQMGYPSSVAGGYPGTMKSAKSVPAFNVPPTFDGEPCPLHHGGPPPPMGVPPMSMPPMVHPGYATMGPPRRAASVYDMRMMSPPPPTIYGTLPHPIQPPAGDARSVAGSTMMGPAAPGAPLGIPPQLLPPMARPRPLVISEGGNPEMLPIRASKDKGANLPKSLLATKGGDSNASEDLKMKKKPFCCKGGSTVSWIILAVVVSGILLSLMLLFIL